MARAFGAETFGELADLMGDLPELPHPRALERAPEPGRAGRRPFWPGTMPFAEVAELPSPPEKAATTC